MDFIEIEGYKSIKKMHLDLDPVNVLIGANGAGKSNFLSFFDFLNALLDGNMRQYVALNGGVEKLLHKGTDSTSGIGFLLSFRKGINGYALNLELGDGELIFAQEHLLHDGQLCEISRSSKGKQINRTASSKPPSIKGYLSEIGKYQFHDTGKNSPFTQLSNVDNEYHHLYEDGRNIAAVLYHLEQEDNEVYRLIISIIQSVAPYFLDFWLRPNKGGLVRLLWRTRYSSTLYGASDLSDGTMRFIALTVLLMQPKPPKSIAIDEPELGLHPFALGKLAGMVDSAAKRGTQVILATQSADLLNHFYPENIVTVDLVDGASQFKRLNAEELAHWLEMYSLGDMWGRSIIEGGQP